MDSLFEVYNPNIWQYCFSEESSSSNIVLQSEQERVAEHFHYPILGIILMS